MPDSIQGIIQILMSIVLISRHRSSFFSYSWTTQVEPPATLRCDPLTPIRSGHQSGTRTSHTPGTIRGSLQIMRPGAEVPRSQFHAENCEPTPPNPE